MKKILVVLIALLALTAFVACSSDPSNQAVGKWQTVVINPEDPYENAIIELEIKGNNSVSYSAYYGDITLSINGTCTANTSTKGSITFVTEGYSYVALYEVEGGKLTLLTGEDPLVFTRK